MARPDAPLNVYATQGDTTITVSWTAVDGANAYVIYRSTTQGSQGYVIGVTADVSWLDTTASLDTGYWYSVQTRKHGSCSLLSGQVRGFAVAAPVPVPDSPTNLMVTIT